MNKLEKIILNRVLCKNCGEVLTSYYRHDYKTCGCENVTMVDGGNEYQRYGGKNGELVDTSVTIFLTEDHMVNRQFAHWGSRGKDGSSPLSFKPIAEMSNNHINNILKDMEGKIAPWMENIMLKEEKYRITNNIIIND
jgi:hypothetical protein